MQTLLKEEIFDCIFKISKNSVVIFAGEGESHKSSFILTDSLEKNIASLSASINESLINFEKKLSRSFKFAKVSVDFGALDIQNIKLLKKSSLDFNRIREKLEEEMGKKIVNISLNGGNNDYHFLQVLTVSKQDIQLIADLVSEAGLEIICVKPDFKFISEHLNLLFKKNKFIMLKFSETHLECALINQDLITRYKVVEEFGMKNFMEEIAIELNASVEAILKIANFYNTTSKVDRLKTFYEREEEDAEISFLIENHSFISALQILLKKKVASLLDMLNYNYNTQSIAVYYECEKYIKIENFLREGECELFEFKYEEVIISLSSPRKEDIMGIFARQMKKFFHLPS